MPIALGNRVFATYGISSPQPQNYEIDYLITPALGGADDIRNLWPQAYSTTVWNAQVKDQLEDYLTTVESGQLPINRALRPTPHQRLIREMILQMKEGHISAEPFQQKFGVNILQEFAKPFAAQQAKGYLNVQGNDVTLTRKGLLQADTLLPEYFEEQHREVRYT